MAQVTITVNGRDYVIACDDGQEAHLTRLARYVDKRARELQAAVGQVGDTRLLVMVSLLIADELGDAYGEIHELRGAVNGTTGPGPRRETDERLAGMINSLAERIETIAEHLEEA